MSEANVIFSFEGVDVKIQCSKEDKMKDICQKYSNKIQKNINSLIFLYNGTKINFNLSYKEQKIDKETNEIKVIVYGNEIGDLICPKCGEEVQLNAEKINDIILSINKLKEKIDGAKLIIENIIKISIVIM